MAETIGVDLPGVTDPDLLYHYRLGVFHAVWGNIDVTTDFAIGQFMILDPEETLLVTWGMPFGAKAKLLSRLIKRSSHPEKQALTTAFNAIKGDAKRDILAHGYPVEDDEHVGFIEKQRGNDFTTKLHVFTRAEFRIHVARLIEHMHALNKALGAPVEDVAKFVEIAKNMEKSPKTSPGKPTS